ncbi:MAG: DUF4388 domain-containing protein [Thermoanaerobaculales bacterium]|nr:DUF4388 domain-containing protein [Thermoanaerobaculales bacterium]
MALQGSLTELSLPDVIQLVSVSGKSGAFKLDREGEKGQIYLKDGQIVDASVGNLRGEHAVYEMAIWSSGEFSFVAGLSSPEVTVHRSNANLMMEAARRLDEWRVLSRRIPSLDLIPYFSPREGQDQVTLSPQEWILVTRVDGERSIEEIGHILRWSAFDVSKLLFGMITSGLVALQDPGKSKDGEGRIKAGPSPITLLGLAEKIRSVALDVVGPGGEKTIEKQYAGARTMIERGEGIDTIKEMVQQNSKAISLLKGADVAAMFDEQVRPLLGDNEGS